MEDKIREIFEEIVINIQTGKWGEPSIEMLQFCSRIHVILEKETV